MNSHLSFNLTFLRLNCFSKSISNLFYFDVAFQLLASGNGSEWTFGYMFLNHYASGVGANAEILSVDGFGGGICYCLSHGVFRGWDHCVLRRGCYGTGRAG